MQKKYDENGFLKPEYEIDEEKKIKKEIVNPKKGMFDENGNILPEYVKMDIDLTKYKDSFKVPKKK